VPGVWGRTLQFAGGAGEISVARKPKLNLGNSLTIEAWVFARATGADLVILDKGATSSQRGYGLRILNGHPALRLQTVACSNLLVADSSASIADSCWHYIVATKSGTNGVIYLDGVI